MSSAAHQRALHAFVASPNVVFCCATGVMILAALPATRLPGAAPNQEA